MKTLVCACLVAVLAAAAVPSPSKAASVKVVEAAADGSEVDLVGASETLQFFFNPATTSWPREIERIVERAGSKVRGGYSHGEVTLKGNVATFTGSGFVPIGKFNFSVK
jgi:hypothetical protein